MKALFRDTVTPVAALLFLVIAMTGVAMFFHLSPNTVRTAHEWLGLVFVAAGAWHAVRNAKPLLSYLRRPTARKGLAISAIAVIATIALTAAPDQPGPRPIVKTLAGAPLGTVAAALGTDGGTAIARLSRNGVTARADQTVADVAKDAALPATTILTIVMTPSPR
ncbi:MAG: DUF4405 domain-containing protein [Telmatospirillum sp.]|nr:DUF4405 domain-containing protein [Telmatospirillum sp.]